MLLLRHMQVTRSICWDTERNCVRRQRLEQGGGATVRQGLGSGGIQQCHRQLPCEPADTWKGHLQSEEGWRGGKKGAGRRGRGWQRVKYKAWAEEWG
jgi:hypothetical protein